MIENVYKKRKHILSFDETIIPDKNLINSLLKKTWKLTPSKNQFMSYTVNVIGPEHKSYKKSIYDICTMNESDTNNNNKIIDKPRFNENLMCLLNAPYTLIFTNRYEDKPNKEQSYLISRGVYYEAADKDNFEKNMTTNLIEVGMFSKILTGLCLENNLDVSYTKCFKSDYREWQKTMPFIRTSPLLIMTIGKGKKAKKPKTYKGEVTDLRPDFERIVEWI